MATFSHPMQLFPFLLLFCLVLLSVAAAAALPVRYRENHDYATAIRTGIDRVHELALRTLHHALLLLFLLLLRVYYYISFNFTQNISDAATQSIN
uniref:Secreted protein n=1 Tax=Anopheles darlingi TaxID=43151 RepID=A0A2M4D3D0_ANODA